MEGTTFGNQPLSVDKNILSYKAVNDMIYTHQQLYLKACLDLSHENTLKEVNEKDFSKYDETIREAVKKYYNERHEQIELDPNEVQKIDKDLLLPYNIFDNLQRIREKIIKIEAQKDFFSGIVLQLTEILPKRNLLQIILNR